MLLFKFDYILCLFLQGLNKDLKKTNFVAPKTLHGPRHPNEEVLPVFVPCGIQFCHTPFRDCHGLGEIFSSLTEGKGK